MQLVKSAPWLLLVNRFAVLNVKEVNTDIHESINTPLPSTPDRKALSWRPKWEKRLSRQLSANTLDACRMSIILPIEISTTDTSEVHSVKALLDSGATGNFIDKDFVHMKGISTQNISHPIPVFNVDSSPNEAGQISKVADIVLCYKTHSKRTFLAISNLRKQSMILSYTWLKDHKMEARAVNICRSGPSLEYAEDSEGDEAPPAFARLNTRQGINSSRREFSQSPLQKTFVSPLQSSRNLRKEPVKPQKCKRNFSPYPTVLKSSNRCSQRKTSTFSQSTGSGTTLSSLFWARSLSRQKSTPCLQWNKRSWTPS